MTIKIVWDNSECTVARIIFPEKWTWDQYKVADYELKEMINSRRNPVGIIVEFIPGFIPPPNSLKNAKEFSTEVNPQVYMIIVIGLGADSQPLFNTFALLNPSVGEMMETASNLTEARRILANNYPTLTSRVN